MTSTSIKEKKNAIALLQSQVYELRLSPGSHGKHFGAFNDKKWHIRHKITTTALGQ